MTRKDVKEEPSAWAIPKKTFYQTILNRYVVTEAIL